MAGSTTRGPQLVEVDQKGLIDKILARYSSKFAVLRELIQNADDASAGKVKIHFETNSEGKISNWIISDTGNGFTPDDWDRLKTIASGNPGSDKVGVFGVGFYSVFSITCSPQIQSGAEAFKFYWGSGNKLYIEPLSYPADIGPWKTVITLPARVNAQLPGSPLEIGRFLAASLPFMANITSVILSIDSTTIVSLEKRVDINPVQVPLRDGFGSGNKVLFETSIESIEKQVVHLHAKAQVWSYDRTTPPGANYDQDVTLWTASISAIPTKASESELRRATKKSVPKLSKIRIAVSSPPTGELFLTNISNVHHDGSNGHVYIGHATAQTTGFAGHVSGHFIPTMERESLDLENNEYVKGWNEQLLYRVGCLARAIYDYELDLMETRKASLESDRHQFVRLLQFFTFGLSHPHPGVSTLIQDAFFTCTAKDILLLTQRGVLPAKSVRHYDVGCQVFLKELTVLDEDISDAIEKMMGRRVADLLQPVSIGDLIAELRSRSMEEAEMAACLDWVLRNNDCSEDSRNEFVNTARFKHGTRIIALNGIKSVLNVQITPSILPLSPLPTSTLPYQISSAISQTLNLKSLLGAVDLTADQWLQHIYTEVTDDNTLFKNIIVSLSQHWQDLGEEKGRIKQILAEKSCIPTLKGTHLPGDAYVSPKMASVFPNLPVIDLTDWEVASSRVAEVTNFLLEIGVRNKIKLDDLLSYIKSCDNRELLKYLLEHDPTEAEKASLRQTPLFTAALTSYTKNHDKPEHFKASELHMPTDKTLQMNLRIAAWPAGIEWDVHSRESMVN